MSYSYVVLPSKIPGTSAVLDNSHSYVVLSPGLTWDRTSYLVPGFQPRKGNPGRSTVEMAVIFLCVLKCVGKGNHYS